MTDGGRATWSFQQLPHSWRVTRNASSWWLDGEKRLGDSFHADADPNPPPAPAAETSPFDRSSSPLNSMPGHR